MDVESPEHLERLRAQPEIKVALLRQWVTPPAREARFERAAKNTAYWPPVEELAARFLANGNPADIRERRELYGRPCWLLATSLAPSPHAPFTIAIVAAKETSVDELVALLTSVTRDYWHGSAFFK